MRRERYSGWSRAPRGINDSRNGEEPVHKQKTRCRIRLNRWLGGQVGEEIEVPGMLGGGFGQEGSADSDGKREGADVDETERAGSRSLCPGTNAS